MNIDFLPTKPTKVFICNAGSFLIRAMHLKLPLKKSMPTIGMVRFTAQPWQ